MAPRSRLSVERAPRLLTALIIAERVSGETWSVRFEFTFWKLWTQSVWLSPGPLAVEQHFQRAAPGPFRTREK